jgi:hypothetical protein
MWVETDKHDEVDIVTFHSFAHAPKNAFESACTSTVVEYPHTISLTPTSSALRLQKTQKMTLMMLKQQMKHYPNGILLLLVIQRKCSSSNQKKNPLRSILVLS